MANSIEREMRHELAELQLELKKRQWLAALRWRGRMKTCLASVGITFTEWLVLDAIWSLVHQTGDAVSEIELGKELELDAMTLWHALAVLEHQGLVSRGCSISGKSWRAFATSKGAGLLRAVKPSLEGASSLSS